MSVWRSVFRNNTARSVGGTASGGALRLVQSTSAVVGDCEFVSNRAVSGVAAVGGAISGFEDLWGLNVSNTLFRGNSAMSGAAIGAFGVGPSGMLSVSQCEFADNAADTSGGAVGFEDVSGVVMVRGTLFRNNSALGPGGVVIVGRTSVLSVR